MGEDSHDDYPPTRSDHRLEGGPFGRQRVADFVHGNR